MDDSISHCTELALLPSKHDDCVVGIRTRSKTRPLIFQSTSCIDQKQNGVRRRIAGIRAKSDLTPLIFQSASGYGQKQNKHQRYIAGYVLCSVYV